MAGVWQASVTVKASGAKTRHFQHGLTCFQLAPCPAALTVLAAGSPRYVLADLACHVIQRYFLSYKRQAISR